MRSVRQIPRRGWLHALWVGLLVGPASAPQTNRKLSGPLPVLGDVVAFEAGPRVVFLADEPEGVFELHSVPIDGSTGSVILNDPLPVGGDVQPGFQVSPDGTRVVYTADQDVNEVFELYSVPIDGSASPVELSGTLVAGGDVQPDIEISPDGTRVVYTADWVNDNSFVLASAPIDGSSAPGIINGPLSFSSDVEPGFLISPDSTRVVYRADQELNERFEIFTTHIVTGGAVKLNDTLVDGGDVFEFEMSADGERVVYRANRDVLGVRELYSVPIDASAAPVELNGPLVGGGAVQRFLIAPDGERVVYLANQEVPGKFELFAAPIDGSAAAVKVSGGLVNAGDVVNAAGSFAITPDGAQVVFVADKEIDDAFELFRAPIDASAAPVQLNGVLVAGGDVQLEFRISPNGVRVVYTADQEADEVFELFSVPIGGGPPVELNDSLVAGGDVDISPDGFRIAPGSNRVAYRADQDTDGVVELYVVPIDAIAAPVRLNDTLVEDGGVLGFRFSGSRVLYLADQAVDEVVELHSVPVNASASPITLNEPFSSNLVNGTVSDFAIAGSRAVYLKDQNDAGRFDLYSVPIQAGGVPSNLNLPMAPDYEVSGFEVTADGATVVYGAGVPGYDTHLFSVLTEGGADPIELSLPGHVDLFRLSPDGERAVAILVNVQFDLYSVPVDGNGILEQLNPVAGNGNVRSFKITPDGTRVVFVDRNSLMSAPIDASAPPIQLNGVLVAGGEIEQFAISPDSQRVVYLADQEVAGVFELYVASIFVTASPVKLNDPLPPGGDVYQVPPSFEISADNARVVFLAEQETNGSMDLYSVPIDASASPVQLNGQLLEFGTSLIFKISPDAARVVYLAAEGATELFSAPIDASASAVKLNPALVGQGDVDTSARFQISGDSTRVVYVADQEVDERKELFGVPIDASSVAVKLNGPLVANGDVLDFTIGADSRSIVYRADQISDQVDELFRASIDASSPAALLNGPLVPGGDVQPDYEISADGRMVFYRADQEVDGLQELFVSVQSRFFLPHPGPTRTASRTQ